MVEDPFTDTSPDGSFVVSRGDFAFLKTALTRSDGSLTTPDSDAFSQTDIRKILDPDGADVTSSWVTNTLDPEDSDDSYDASHADYVGDVASPANTGLFAEGYNNGSGTANGRLAQKVKVPTNAEVTSDNSDRSYQAVWKIKKNGNFVTATENFNVSDSGVLIFSGGLVTVSEVEAGINTTLTDSQIEDIITEVTLRTKGYLEVCGVDVDDLDSLPYLVRTAVIWGSRATILQVDLAAGQSVSKMREGNKSISFGSGTDSQKIAETYWDKWEADLDRYCAKAGYGASRLKTRNKRKWHDVLGDSRYTFGAARQRERK